jgi:hypothetical protein
MRAFGAFPSLRVSRNPLVTFLIFLFVIFLGYQAAQAILANDLSSLVLAGMLVLAGAVVVAVLNDWRRGLYMLVAWILFEDFVRKYLGNNMAIYFDKDLLAILLYLFFLSSQACGAE